MNFKKFQKISISFLSVLLILIFGLFILGATREVQAQYDFYNPPSGDVSQPIGGYDFYNPPSGDISQPATNNIDITCAKYQYPWCQESAKNPAGLVARFYQIALGLVGAAALGVLIYGAILWTVSGAVTSKQDALEWIKGALWGLVLLLGAYLILWTINPDLVNLKNPAMEFISLPSDSATSTPTTVNCNNVSPGNCGNFKECELVIVADGSNKCIQKTTTAGIKCTTWGTPACPCPQTLDPAKCKAYSGCEPDAFNVCQAKAR